MSPRAAVTSPRPRLMRRLGGASGSLPRRLGGAFASLLRRQGGGVAVEFALVLIPFVGLTLAIIETALLLFTESVVQGAVNTAARQIRTGQLAAGPGSTPAQQAATLQAFEQQVCNNLAGQLSCSQLTFDVRSFTSFSAISLPPPVYDQNGVMTNASFATGGPTAVVAVRAIYNWTPITPGLAYILGAGSDQPYTITYTVILRNEPFG